MSRGKWWLALTVGAIMLVAGASIALADDAVLDGEYTLDLNLPGIGQVLFGFEVNGGATVSVTATPSDYEIDDDDDPGKVAWRDIATMSLEVEAKTDKVEGGYDWLRGPAILTLPDGETITITDPDGGGVFVVTATGDWSAISDEHGRDWYVVNGAGDVFFKVEANDAGVEIKAVDGFDDGFENELTEEDDDALEIEAEELEEEAEEEEKDKDDD